MERRIGDVTLKLHSHQKMLLAARSETIVQAITNKNFLRIVKSEETKPKIFIDSCLVKPEEYACPVSIINTTEELVEITTSLVTLSEIQVSDRTNVLTLQSDNAESIQARRERLNNQLSLEHLNNEEKKAIEGICKDFCDIFYLEDDTWTFTSGSTRNHYKSK